MNYAATIRLAGVSLLFLVTQQALLQVHPEWRTGLDIYLVWLLIVSASRGFSTGLVLALIGGLVMDAPSIFGLFHTLFYLLPVGLGAFLSSHLVVEYNLLASLAVCGLLLLKLLLLATVGSIAGWLPHWGYLFHLNYWPLLILTLLVFIFWQRLAVLMPPLRMVTSGR
jgi:hypothetical protein